MAVRLSPVAIAVASALTLAACGGGGGGSSSTPNTTPASVNVTVTPSLGQFSAGCVVELRKGTGESVGSGIIGANGTVTIPVTSFTGALIATVKGSDSCTYFDEASGTDKPFAADKKLTAVVPALGQSIGVNVLTHIAAARVLDSSGGALASGQTAETVTLENTAVGNMFQVSNILTPPLLLNKDSGKALNDTEAGKLAAKLAALAEIASSQSSSVAELAALLAEDLKDGTLNSVDSTKLQAGLIAAVTKYADTASKGSLDDLASQTVVETDANKARTGAQTVLAAGTSLAQAKQIFADLRTSILSISNESGTGSLDQQNALLKEDFKNGVHASELIEHLSLMVEAINEIYIEKSAVSKHSETGSCAYFQVGSPALECLVRIPGASRGYRIVLRPSAGGTSVAWEVTGTRDLVTNTVTALTGLTGTITRELATGKNTLVGKFYPMTEDGATTAVDTNFTYTGTKGTQKWVGNGTLETLKADGATSTLKVAITEFTADEALKTAKLVGTLTGPHHRFDGSLEIADLITSLDGVAEPKTAKFVGSFTNITNPAAPFKFLEGRVNFSQDNSAYTYTQPETDTNFVKLALSFTGTAYKSADVPGVALSLTVNNTDGFTKQKGEFTFTGLNGLALTGKAGQSATGWSWEIKNANGITLTYVPGLKSGTVKNADGTTLGSISSQRVTFIDNTYASLI